MWLGQQTVSSLERCPIYSVLYREVPLYTQPSNDCPIPVMVQAPSFFLLPTLLRSVPQLNRFSGQPCFQLPHVFWLVVALLLTFTVIFPIPVFILVINLKQFSVRMETRVIIPAVD